ncbi:methylated-DNA--[protein]-cysteine S-methyltransferase [Zhihengliuella salsuginis]|uniref:Methylated-DNA--protein-cysteine methyltransferase n=1 Tax=Zhihengliuella salsuginis TaxID=578222 RepID=A0ABQ3GAB5_9MICC|nr:methylated-DNA--[protein]-cysteine S-methyltransferase [Zhihengliuella salsuginis]GHC98839.1 methylated-DNA--protein-cysteine methyltransferase [Zhihengliuella salsuginis]
MRHLIAEAPALTATPLGALTIAGDGGAVTGIWFGDHRYPPTTAQLGERVAPGDDALLDDAAAQLAAYAAGRSTGFDLPLDPAGTPGQRAVWDLLSRIDRGSTTTYGSLAAAVGSPRGAQAVGQAVGRNPLSIVVPCHRVLAADGKITGYAGGEERKRFLLALEGAALL